MVKKTLFNFDKKKLIIATGIDIGSILFFLLATILMINLFAFVMPENLIPKESWNLADSSELETMKSELITYIVAFFIIMPLLLFVSLSIYVLSRKLIWSYMDKKRFSMDGFWKYFMYAIGVLFAVYSISALIYFIISLFFGMISYLMSFLNYSYVIMLTQVIPLTLLFYISSVMIHYLNNSYFQNDGAIRKIWKNIKDFRMGKYVIPMLMAFLGTLVLHVLLYAVLPPSSLTLSFIVIIIFSLQAAYLKTMVNHYEEKKGFLGLFKR